MVGGFLMAGSPTQVSSDGTYIWTVDRTEGPLSRFLRLAFSSIHIPPAVLPSVLDTYMPRFAYAFAHNEHLTAGVTPLVQWLTEDDDYNDLVSLVRTANPHVLDALLDTDESRYLVLRAVIETWLLSLSDQIRLVNRDFSPADLERILYSPDLSTKVLVELAQHTDQDPDFIRQLGAIVDPTPTPGQSRARFTRPPEDMHQVSVNHLDKTIALLASLHAVTAISTAVNDYLGEGTDPLSLTAWLNFFGLCQNDPDVPLAAVLATALRLARAQLTSVPQTVLPGTGN